MNNFGKNAMGGLLGAIYLMCFAFPIGLVMDVFRDHMPIGQFLANQVITFLAVWFVGYFFVQMYREMLANANKPRSEDDDGKTANKTDINTDGKTSNKTDDDSNDKQ
ncbi:hypothetical protein BH11CYA1_BH11CYA1_29860 [soil metagenome]